SGRLVGRPASPGADPEPAQDRRGRHRSGHHFRRRRAGARGLAAPGLRPGGRRGSGSRPRRDRTGWRPRRVRDQAEHRNQGHWRPHPGPRRHARPDRQLALQRPRPLPLFFVCLVPRMKSLTLLGATGSIGLRTLDLVSSFPEEFSVEGLAARGSNVERVADLCKKYSPRAVALLEADARDQLARLLPTPRPELLAGPDRPGALGPAARADLVLRTLGH